MSPFSPIQDPLYYVFFASTSTLALIASCYLLLRRNNAFSSEVNSPVRLRRWTAAFFASVTMSHTWWLVLYYLAPPSADSAIRALICICLDVVFTMPTLLCTMLVTLQDRRRKMWPVTIIVALSLFNVLLVHLQGNRITTAIGLIYLLSIAAVIIGMILALRYYRKWLRENYADLEHKEVAHIYWVLFFWLLTSLCYGLANLYSLFEVLMEVGDIVLIVFLLWRVETLQALEEPEEVTTEAAAPSAEVSSPKPLYDKLERLLREECVGTQFYLRHDASLTELAKLIGTNRNYLSQHFAQQGITYNTYINNLRIEHFKRLFKQSMDEHSDLTATELAAQSGFRRYATFSEAFKQCTGQTATEWMKATRNAGGESMNN